MTKVTELKRQKIMEMGVSMRVFAEECFRATLRVKSPSFHDIIYNDLNDDSVQNLLVVAPRGHAKSSLVGEIQPIHRAIYSALMGKKPEFIVLVSKTSSHTRSMLTTIKYHLNGNDQLKYYFGDWGEQTAKRWADNEIILKNNTVITALGMGSQIHGLKRFQQRPTMFILDDPEDDSNAGTIESMDKNYEWFEKALMAARDPQFCRIVVIGTMINEGCLVDRLKRLPGWRVHWFKAIPDRVMPDGTHVAWSGEKDWDVLWPEWWPYKKLMEEKERQEIAGKGHIWWMNYQNEFRTGANQPFRREYFKKYSGECVKVREGKFVLRIDTALNADNEVLFKDRYIPINIFWGYDPATSESNRADCTAIEFWGMDAKKNCYLLWKLNKRIDALAAAEEFFTQALHFNPVTGNIETVQAQETIRSYLRHKMNEEGVWINGLDKKNQPRAKKSERILSDLWRYKNGMIYVRDGIDEDFIAQAVQYVIDKETQHEDMLDAQYYAFKDAWPCDSEWEETLDKVEESERRVCTIGLDDLVDQGVTWMGL